MYLREWSAAGVVAFYNNWEEIFVFSEGTRERENESGLMGVCRIIIIINISNEESRGPMACLYTKCMHMHLFECIKN